MTPPARPDRRHPQHRRSPRDPGESGAIWLFGLHPVLAAIANPRRRLLRLIATAATEPALSRAAAAAPKSRPTVEVFDGRALESVLPPGTVHQGVAALAAPLDPPDLAALIAATGPTGCVLVLDQVTDPRNVGATLRAAAAFAAAAVVVQDRHAPEATGTLAKAAAGALEIVPLVRVTNIARTLRALQDQGFTCVGLDGTAALSLAAADLGGRVALVLGSEGEGLRRLVGETCDVLVRIPIAPDIESLNVATAAAIALYELRRTVAPA